MHAIMQIYAICLNLFSLSLNKRNVGTAIKLPVQSTNEVQLQVVVHTHLSSVQ